MDKSTVALMISGLSLLLTFWNIFRDRSRLHVESKFYESHPNYGSNRIYFKAINKGRRPIYIRMVGGELLEHGWLGEYVGDSEFGKKLEEGQYIEFTWQIEDVFTGGPDFDDEYKSIWLEDSLGKRYKVPSSDKYLKRIKSSNKSIQPNADASAD